MRHPGIPEHAKVSDSGSFRKKVDLGVINPHGKDIKSTRNTYVSRVGLVLRSRGHIYARTNSQNLNTYFASPLTRTLGKNNEMLKENSRVQFRGCFKYSVLRYSCARYLDIRFPNSHSHSHSLGARFYDLRYGRSRFRGVASARLRAQILLCKWK